MTTAPPSACFIPIRTTREYRRNSRTNTARQSVCFGHSTATSTGLSVTGVVARRIVRWTRVPALSSPGTFSSGSCTQQIRPTQFDGSYALERLPVGRNYNLYAEPLVGIALPSDFDEPADLCSQDVTPSCTAPAATQTSTWRTLPASP